MSKLPKIAIIDLLFQYPPRGGSCVDLIETFSRLGAHYEMRLFYLRVKGEFRRGQVDGETAFPFSLCPIELGDIDRHHVITETLKALELWKPDAVFIADGWTLKTYVAAAVSDLYPTIVRFYAYETLCPRNNECWLHDHPCDNLAILDCVKCLECAQDYRAIIEKHKGENGNILTDEAKKTRIWDGDYQSALSRSLRNSEIIVYNHTLGNLFEQELSKKVHVIPGGVDLSNFPACNESLPSQNDVFTILAFGRMSDTAKGAPILIEAVDHLIAKGHPLKLVLTRDKTDLNKPWLTETGWLSRRELIEQIKMANLTVMPSSWQEAFGMTWVEAMAMKKPVICSAVAGPLDWIVDGENGLLFKAGDSKELAEKILSLKNNPKLRETIARNGYDLVKTHLTWDHTAAKTRKVISQVLESPQKRPTSV